MVTAGDAAPSTLSSPVESSDALLSARGKWEDSDVGALSAASVCARGSVTVLANDKAESTSSEEGRESVAAREVAGAMSMHKVFSGIGAVTGMFNER